MLDFEKSPVYAALKKAYDRFVRLRGEPRELALGMALGLFLGLTPTIGFQIVLAVFFASLFKWSKLTAVAGVWITNPLTAPVVYGMTYLTGAKILGLKNSFSLADGLSLDTISLMLQKTPELILALTVGGITLGLPLAAAGYYVTFNAVTRYREDLKKRIERQRERLGQLKARSKNRRSKKKRRTQKRR